MGYLSDTQFFQYKYADKELRSLRRKHATELRHAYDSINPTLTRTDYDMGMLYVESVDPVEYAAYLLELREEHEQIESWWEERAEVFREAFDQLTDTEKRIWVSQRPDYFEKETVIERLKSFIKKISETKSEKSNFYSIDFSNFETMEEADERIEKLSEKELLEGYWDLYDENFQDWQEK